MEKNNKIKEIYDKLSTPEEKVLDLLEQINKEKLKGDNGKTPVKGEDYFTEEEISEFLKFVTPKKGKDYHDGKTPTDEEIIALIKPFIPPPIPGKDGSIITPEEVRDKLKELKGKERLSVFDLKDIEFIKGKNGEHIQWSSAGFKIFTDTTLAGDGSQNNPLHVASAGGVTKIVAGTNVTISPISGLGNVTINSTGGGSQTPWTSDINGAGYNLFSVGKIGIGTTSPSASLSVQGSADAIQGIFKQNSTQNNNLIQFQESNGTVFGSIGGVDSSTSSNGGVYSFYDKGLAVNGNGATDYEYGSVLSVHADDELPYLAKFYNDTYSTTTPVFSYFAYNSGTFIQSTFGSQMQFSTNGLSRIDMTIATNGYVGIGVATPLARLHLAAGSTTVSPLRFTSGALRTSAVAGDWEYLNNIFISRGGAGLWLDGATGSTPTSGAGTRLMWIPAKSAIRAGKTVSSQWDDASVGVSSTVFGDSGTASGQYAVSMGYGNVASGIASTAFGYDSAVGDYDIAAGRSIAMQSAKYSAGFGAFGLVAADYSLISGYYTKSNGPGGVALGYNASLSTLAFSAGAPGKYGSGVLGYNTNTGPIGNTIQSLGTGINYVAGNHVTVPGGDGAGVLSIDAVANGGLYTAGITIANGGSGYSAGSGFMFTDTFSAFATVLTVDGSGAILTIRIDSAGSGYTVKNNAPTTFFGGGAGAIFNITATLSGIPQSFSVFTAGSGYTSGTVSPTGGSGTGLTVGINIVTPYMAAWGSGSWSIGQDVNSFNVDNVIAIGRGFNAPTASTFNVGFDQIDFQVRKGRVSLLTLPTSSAGLSTGDLWNNSGVINIV